MHVGREGESSGWDSSSSPVMIQIVVEDSRELLREWKIKVIRNGGSHQVQDGCKFQGRCKLFEKMTVSVDQAEI